MFLFADDSLTNLPTNCWQHPIHNPHHQQQQHHHQKTNHHVEQKEIEIKQCVVVVLRNFMASGVTRVIAFGYWCFFFSFPFNPFFLFSPYAIYSARKTGRQSIRIASWLADCLFSFTLKILPTTIILFNRQQNNVDKIMQIGWLVNSCCSTWPARLMCSCLLCVHTTYAPY